MEGVELLEGEVFKQIIGYDNYYISNKGRCYNAKNKRFIGAYDKYGYIIVGFHNKGKTHTFKIHRLVMAYFGPPQPEGMLEIDHKNHICDDNRIENLRWCNRVQNNKNRTGANKVQYELFDEIPADEEDIIEIRDYGNHEFQDLYYADNCFYLYTGINYRRLHINYKKTGAAFVYVYDIENKMTTIYYAKFKKLYGLN